MHELELLQSIYSQASTSEQITIGPGDDLGEICIGEQRVLCGADQLVVGKHVTFETPPELIGRKAVARCFSDVAAMGAVPIGSLMTACIPSDIENDWCRKVFAGAKEVAEQWGGPIFGGDISSGDGPPIFTVTVIAMPAFGKSAIRRTGAQVGDFVCVTGELGNSIDGHHLTFTPRIQEAQELFRTLGHNLHSMVDISDGLGQDASNLASKELQLVLDTALLPLREGASIEGAISDGEDYELLFTTSEKPPNHLATVIGTVELGTGTVMTTDGRDISTCGWVHT